MKKILLSIMVFASSAVAMAQSHAASAMTFVGKSNLNVSTANVANDADTVKFTMNGVTSGDIAIPAVTYNMMGKDVTIPAFTIHNAAFTMDMATMSATFADQTFSETVGEKTITGTSLTGSYNHASNTLDLVVKFKYGAMPLVSTYTITGYYVKGYTDSLAVSVNGTYNYTADDKVTYNIRKYMDGDVEKLDVEVPAYTIANSLMGDLTIGTYTVKGLTYDEAKGGYYKDYSADGLSMYFKAVSGGVASMDNTYSLSKEGQNILVEYSGSSVVVTNNFAPGAMPFPITSTFPKPSTTGIDNVGADVNTGSAAFNLAGQRVARDAKGIVIINGRKYLNK